MGTYPVWGRVVERPAQGYIPAGEGPSSVQPVKTQRAHPLTASRALAPSDRLYNPLLYAPSPPPSLHHHLPSPPSSGSSRCCCCRLRRCRPTLDARRSWTLTYFGRRLRRAVRCTVYGVPRHSPCIHIITWKGPRWCRRLPRLDSRLSALVPRRPIQFQSTTLQL